MCACACCFSRRASSIILNYSQFQSHSNREHVIVKRIQGGTKHDITLRLSSTFSWDTATLTLHLYNKPTELLPFRVETYLGSRVWIEYATGCVIHADAAPLTYSSVRVQFCKYYYDQPLQFTMTDMEGRTGSTVMPVVIVKHKLPTAPAPNSTFTRVVLNVFVCTQAFHCRVHCKLIFTTMIRIDDNRQFGR